MSVLGDGALARLRALASEEPEVVADRFELQAPLGEGGMGVVWSAWDRQDGREVAVKVLRDPDPAARERFAREAAALRELAGAAVPRPIAEGLTEAGVPFLAMERLSGRTLADRLLAGRLGVRETVALGRAAAAALAAVHAGGLVHRDVKPSNLFLVRGDAADVRLLDFGLARGKDGLRVTKTGALVGTPGYMAPEQVRGEARIGPRADVFALGAVLFECLAGRPAFFAEDAVQVLAKILLEEPPLAAEVRPAVPLALEGIVEAMLAKDPALRPDAATVAQELSAIEAIVVEPSEGARPAVGAMIGGKYRVEGTIGEGGMGVILEATHVELGRKVAIKILRGRRGDDEARLLREARALSQLTSEHAARVLDVGKLDDGAPYMVIERLEGRDLGRELRERGSLPCAEAARHVVAACEAIAEAHELGIIHRDLKPSNLFLARRRDGSTCLKVLDFGISKVEESAPGERSLTSATAVLGSPWYMSPEQLASAKAVDARSDVWALGVVLHELCTGAPPFDAETAAGVGAKIAAAAATPLRALRKEAPEALEKAILRCLAKDPAARFPSARELARALAGIEAPPRRAPRRGAAAAVVVLAGIGVAAMALRPRAPVETAPSARVAIDAAPPAISASAVASATAPATATATAISSAVARPAAKPRPPPLAGALPVAVLPPIVSAAPPPPPPPAPPPKPTAPPRTVDLGDPALDGR